jgi:hypothetical protein
MVMDKPTPHCGAEIKIRRIRTMNKRIAEDLRRSVMREQMEKTLKEAEPTEKVQVKIAFEVELPVVVGLRMTKSDKRCLFQAAENKLRDLMEHYSMNEMDEFMNTRSCSWSIHRQINDLDEEE